MNFRLRDAAEVAGGAALMGFPIAVTEEVWNLGAELNLPHVLYFAAGSLLFLSLYIYYLHRDKQEPASAGDFALRVLSTYSIALLVSALLLFGVDRLELFTDPIVGLKRMFLVAFPASFAATTIDSFASDKTR
jgi:uncharacterized membrane protein